MDENSMKTPCIIVATLLLTLCAAYAAPTGTVTRSVITDTNGYLIMSSTNLAALNGLATTAQLSGAIAPLSTISNLAVSGIASAAVAQATADAGMATGTAAQVSAEAAMATGMAAQTSADYAMATGTAAQATADAAVATNTSLDARLVGIETNHATAAQGALADTALQPDGMGSNLIAHVTAIDTSVLIVSGASNSAVNGTYTWDADWPYADSIAGATNGAFVQSTSNYFVGRWYGCSSAWVLSTNGGFAETGVEYTTPYDGDPLTPTNGWFADTSPAPAPTVQYYGGTVTRVEQVATKALNSWQLQDAIWHTNQFPGLDGSTNTIIYLGVP
jgi:hypothetical protein